MVEAWAKLGGGRGGGRVEASHFACGVFSNPDPPIAAFPPPPKLVRSYEGVFSGGLPCANRIAQYNPPPPRPPRPSLARALSPLLFGQADVIKLLLDYGAPVDQPDATGGTALMRAAMGGQVAAVEVLTSRGADVSAQKTDTGTAQLTVPSLTSGNLSPARCDVRCFRNSDQCLHHAGLRLHPVAAVPTSHGFRAHGVDLRVCGSTPPMPMREHPSRSAPGWLLSN